MQSDAGLVYKQSRIGHRSGEALPSLGTTNFINIIEDG